MRLFQAQNYYGETASPAPPTPSFSIDREITRVMPVYLNQFRDGRRLPTPEKVAVMELSNSFERRRLGKHQRILNDISERCRAQEINDLSNKLSNKMSLHRIGKPSREMTFYSTTFMGPKNYGKQTSESGCVTPETGENGKPKMFEKNYRQFPARRIMRQQTKFEFLRQATMLPKLQVNTLPMTSHSDGPDVTTLRAKLAQRRQINGTIQLDHYVTPRPDLAPLILPTVEGRFFSGIQSERLDRQDTCFSTSRLVLGPRTRTQLTVVNCKTNSADKSALQKPLPLSTFGHELSQLQLTSGHSPPPNSVQEAETLVS